MKLQSSPEQLASLGSRYPHRPKKSGELRPTSPKTEEIRWNPPLASLYALLSSSKGVIPDVDQAVKGAMDVGDCHQR
jgi:hypothetical protein